MKVLMKFLVFTFVLIFANQAFAADSFIEALKEGKPYIDIRLRYESVDQKGKIKAKSRTGRTRLGFKTGEWMDFKAVIEGENVSYLGSDHFNDTVNGKTDRATVADPENTQVNQAYLQFSGIPDTYIKGGRQVIAIDGQRFIGHVGKRQNNQVFDAFVINNKSIPDTEFKYGYIYNVNRIFGEQSVAGDWRGNSHFYNISNNSLRPGKITTYGYMLDFGSDSAANSNKSFGLSLAGKKELNDDFTFKYYWEFASQSEAGDNPTAYSANYYHLAPALAWKGLVLTVGREVLGSDNGTFAFRTPLATGHKFNGWADKFLTTPANGLEDFYIDLTYKVKKLEGNLEFLNGLLAKFQYHDFNANHGGMDHGKEWGLYFKKPIHKHVTVSTKYANYDADNTSKDTEKFTFDVAIKY